MRTAAFCMTFFLMCGAFAQAGPKVSLPLDYSGYTEAEYESHQTHSVYVPMRDGVRLAVDYFVPEGGPEKEAFPVILQYTPYQRSTINPKTGRINDWGTSQAGRFFLSHGYALVFADMRGTGASTGWLMDFMPELAEDGKELVDWIAGQAWCDGNVGMTGGSYLGWSQTATAMHRPEALKCIMPAVIPLEGYTGEVYPGGIYLQGFLKLWSGGIYYSQRSYFDPKRGMLPAKPAADEDGDGAYEDEIPIDANGNGTFLDDGPPRYADGEERKDLFYNAIKGHEKNLDYASWAGEAFYIDAETPVGITLSDISPNAHLPAIMESGIPIYHVGGWFDGFARGTFELFATARETNHSKVIMFPGYHNVIGGPYYAYLGEDLAPYRKRLLDEQIRFFDRHLKDIRNGIDTEPPIYLYVMNGAGWRFEKEWPLARRQLTDLYLMSGQALAGNRGGGGEDTYKADFTHSSTYGRNQGNRWLGIGGMTPSGLPIRTEKDKQCLTYTGAAIEEAIEVTGHPIVHLWISSTASYGDFFVYLEDVDETGEVVLVTEGQLRAGYAALHDNDGIIYNANPPIDVLPELPWHGYKKEQYVDGILAGGKAVELVIDFHPTSWVFKKGHKIRLAIACADSPTYRLHPKLSPKNDPTDSGNTLPTITVHRTELRPSRLVLPVIPGP